METGGWTRSTALCTRVCTTLVILLNSYDCPAGKSIASRRQGLVRWPSQAHKLGFCWSSGYEKWKEKSEISLWGSGLADWVENAISWDKNKRSLCTFHYRVRSLGNCISCMLKQRCCLVEMTFWTVCCSDHEKIMFAGAQPQCLNSHTRHVCTSVYLKLRGLSVSWSFTENTFWTNQPPRVSVLTRTVWVSDCGAWGGGIPTAEIV